MFITVVKKQIKKEIEENNIRIYEFPENDQDQDDENPNVCFNLLQITVILSTSIFQYLDSTFII